MNDRFKFRIWNKQSNNYIKEKMFYIDKFGGLFKYEKSKSIVYINAPSPYVMCLCGNNYIVEQCTGLKDKNGKLIYEGDIVKLSSYREVVCPVVWDNEETGFCVKYKKELYRFNTYKKYHLIEVVGNIHKNADLLEVKND